MDPKELEQHPAQAEQHVTLGRKHIARQMEIIAELEGKGQDVTLARDLLIVFEDLQRTHVADRHRTRKGLVELDNGSD